MQFTKLSAVVLASTVLSALAQTGPQQLFAERIFDDPNGSVTNTNCPALAAAHPTFGSFYTYPSVGQTYLIPPSSLNHALCGSCWQLTHTDNNGQTNTTYFTAVGGLPNQGAWNMSPTGVRRFTGLEANQLPATIQAQQVDRSLCHTN